MVASRWCWWTSFKENEGEEGKKRRGKERYLDPSCSRNVVVNTACYVVVDVRLASHKPSNLLQDNNNNDNECLCDEHN